MKSRRLGCFILRQNATAVYEPARPIKSAKVGSKLHAGPGPKQDGTRSPRGFHEMWGENGVLGGKGTAQEGGKGKSRSQRVTPPCHPMPGVRVSSQRLRVRRRQPRSRE